MPIKLCKFSFFGYNIVEKRMLRYSKHVYKRFKYIQAVYNPIIRS